MDCIKSLENCPDSIIGFALFGKVVAFLVVWAVIGAITAAFVKAYWKKDRYSDFTSDQKGYYVLAWIFWPIVWVYVVLCWIIGVIELPFTAVRKRDLDQMEQRVNQRIEETRNHTVIPILKQKFSPGDLITGVHGNPDAYKHLDEGCVCRVLSINEKDQMKVILVDHVDFDEQKNWIGKEFKAPARNFVKYPRKRKITKPKKKPVKKKKK